MYSSMENGNWDQVEITLHFTYTEMKVSYNWTS
jgi:hypothetical protein